MRRNHQYYVYIITNTARTIFYIGVTNNMYRRMEEHRQGMNEGFSKKYGLRSLMYVEVFDSIIAAITREKQLKNWHRPWKINLIRSTNPEMKDLTDQLLNS